MADIAQPLPVTAASSGHWGDLSDPAFAAAPNTSSFPELALARLRDILFSLFLLALGKVPLGFFRSR